MGNTGWMSLDSPCKIRFRKEFFDFLLHFNPFFLIKEKTKLFLTFLKLFSFFLYFGFWKEEMSNDVYFIIKISVNWNALEVGHRWSHRIVTPPREWPHFFFKLFSSSIIIFIDPPPLPPPPPPLFRNLFLFPIGLIISLYLPVIGLNFTCRDLTVIKFSGN